ncbi:MAG: error-prone DNA polymerase, partial [Caulobacterales bacterium]|nr:error-prone DNA polymerase [Caulobacterales bacterium]
ITLEDETGVVNAIVWPKVFARFRRVVMGARVVRVSGRLQREGLVVHLVADTLSDFSHKLVSLSDGVADLGDPTARADEIKRHQDDPRQSRRRRRASEADRAARIVVPKSRDFH